VTAAKIPEGDEFEYLVQPFYIICMLAIFWL
jgi:hypothetical protein